jgi:hypothetical protein
MLTWPLIFILRCASDPVNAPSVSRTTNILPSEVDYVHPPLLFILLYLSVHTLPVY